MSMTEQEQQIAIAEWMGWMPYYTGEEHWKSPEGKICLSIPDYLNDLNAMREAEKRLTSQERYVFSVNLHAIVYLDDKTDEGFFLVVSATSQQRSEALCRTLWPERWKE